MYTPADGAAQHASTARTYGTVFLEFVPRTMYIWTSERAMLHSERFSSFLELTCWNGVVHLGMVSAVAASRCAAWSSETLARPWMRRTMSAGSSR
jgi:hypothetical protein